MNWELAKFDQVFEVQPKEPLVKGELYSFISMEQIQPSIRDVFPNETRQYTGGGARFREGDTLFARITPCLENGKIAMARGLQDHKGFGSTEFFIFRAIPSRTNPNFLYYLARTELVRGTAINSMTGATGRQRADICAIANLEILLPPLHIQQRISQVLSTYDNLINNNNRRIALLEESIHLLYKEWFVRSRFPGYESVKVVDGIPEGWSKAPATQVIDFNPKTSAPKGEVRPYLPMEAVSTNSMIISEIDTRPVGGGAKFKNGDTLLARITPCLENGKTAFVQFMEDDNMVATGSTEFIVMRSTHVTPYWVYCLARSHNFRQHAINSMAGSDGRQRVKPECFDQYTVLCSPLQILKYFDTIAAPIFKQIKYLNSQNQKLKEARDLLLPRLMNGSIAV